MNASAVIATVLAGIAAGFAGAQEVPTTRVRDCTTAGCHAPVIDHDVLHGPAAISACDACHEYRDPERHSFVLKREGSALCTFCHVGADTQLGMVGHQPFDQGDCTGCHDPHGGHDKNLLKGRTQADLCATCHPGSIIGSHVHTPAAEGNCLSCHGAHGAEHAGLLNRTGSALCFTCHQDTRTRLDEAAHVHGPATGDCLDCHAAHASDVTNHLSMEPLALCSSCHVEAQERARHASFGHSAVTDGRACLHCHQAHASNHAGLMHDDPIGACLECHREPITTDDGRTIAGVPEIAEPGAVLHGPVRQEQCTGCHELHGSDHVALLTADYTQDFYAPFKLEHYELCFQCHSKELVLARESTAETNFRNGSLNLHFVHVNMERQGRSCRSCHATHASQSELHVVESVRFGSWELPLNFARTETGGSCNSGCHRPATYDRTEPTQGILGREAAAGAARAE